MVDPVGGKPLSIAERSVRSVERAPPVRAVETPVRPETAPAPTTGFGQVARDLAAGPPVDSDRVARIRRAIAEGKFPISPATIADHLLALKLNWTGNDQA